MQDTTPFARALSALISLGATLAYFYYAHGITLWPDHRGDGGEDQPTVGWHATDGHTEDALKNESATPTVLFRRERKVLQPTLWRRNRKHITDLTTLTSIKSDRDQSEDAQSLAPSTATKAPRAVSNQRTSLTGAWLSNRFYPMSNRAGLNGATMAKFPLHGEVTASDVAITRLARRRRHRQAHGSEQLCQELQRRYGVSAVSAWDALPPSQHEAWHLLRCDERLTRQISETQLPARSDRAAAVAGMRATRNQGSSQAFDAAVRTDSVDGETDRSGSPGSAVLEQCQRMANINHVIIGKNWGTLALAERRLWTHLRCDAALGGQHDVRSGLASDAATLKPYHSWCLHTARIHRVKIGLDWGSLPRHGQKKWAWLGCDKLLRQLTQRPVYSSTQH